MTAIVSVAGAAPPVRQCCNCHRTATRLCDWKIGSGRTCDKPMCPTAACGSSPAPGKDLCPAHTRAWAARQKEKGPDANAQGPESGQRPLL